MAKFKLFEEFVSEKQQGDLHKIYLAIDPKSGHRWWSYKGFAGDNFFIQVNANNYKQIDLNPEYPVLTYNSKIINKLIDEKLIDPDKVYNKPEFIELSGSKKKFHETIGDDENIPKTSFSKDEAIEKIGFPMIAKPSNGHSGIGILVFKDKESFDKADHNKLEVYSQYIDKKSEHRLICFKGKTFAWMERKPMNDKAKTGDGSGKDQMSFKYIKRNPKSLPNSFVDVVSKFCKIFKDLSYICFDLMEDKNGKIYIIESNSQPGVPFDITVQAYRVLFKDFYGRDVDNATDMKLKEMSAYLDQKTLELEPDRFEINMK